MSQSLSHEELFDGGYLDALRQFTLILKKRKDLQKKGTLNSHRIGQTREFKDYRAYVPMDDLRSIDWRLYGRLDKLFVRLFEDQQQTHVNVYVDASRSMLEPYREKWVTQAKLAVALAYLSWQSHHKVSVHSFAGNQQTLIRSSNDTEGFKRLTQAMIQLQSAGVSDFSKVGSQRSARSNRAELHVVVSDFLSPNQNEISAFISKLRSFSGEKQLVQVLHPEEMAGTRMTGEAELEDVESGEKYRLNINDLSTQSYRENLHQHQETLKALSARANLAFDSFDVTEPFEVSFRKLILNHRFVGRFS